MAEPAQDGDNVVACNGLKETWCPEVKHKYLSKQDSSDHGSCLRQKVYLF